MKTIIYISIIPLLLIMNLSVKSNPAENHKEQNQKSGLIDLAPYNNTPDNHNYFGADGVHASLPLNFFMDRYTDAYANEMKEFCYAVLENKPVSVGGKDGLLSVAIGLAAKKSVAEKRPVKVSEIL